jgi:flavin-dependent dehydrogenase
MSSRTKTVAVVGGGPAGSVCARELAGRGHQVVLVERGRPARQRLGETAGPALRRQLEACGLRPAPQLFHPLKSLFASWGGAEAEARSYAFWHADDGLLLDREAFDAWLLDCAAEAGVDVRRGCQVEGVRPDGEGWVLAVRRGELRDSLAVGFVVEATGRAARSVVHADAVRFYTDRLVCLSVEFPTARGAASEALVESCAAGWWYAVLLPDGNQLLAFFTDADLAGPRGSREEVFKAALDATLHIRRLAADMPAGAALRVADARTSARRVLWRGRWLCVGDAAWCLDPLSGKGIERAVADGLGAARAVSELMTGRGEGAIRTFAVSSAEAFNESLNTQRSYYAADSRWPNSPFWRRRSRP